eukprot:10987574-Alexandrium_andersonii.AAC.1
MGWQGCSSTAHRCLLAAAGCRPLSGTRRLRRAALQPSAARSQSCGQHGDSAVGLRLSFGVWGEWRCSPQPADGISPP